MIYIEIQIIHCLTDRKNQWNNGQTMILPVFMSISRLTIHTIQMVRRVQASFFGNELLKWILFNNEFLVFFRWWCIRKTFIRPGLIGIKEIVDHYLRIYMILIPCCWWFPILIRMTRLWNTKNLSYDLVKYRYNTY